MISQEIIFSRIITIRTALERVICMLSRRIILGWRDWTRSQVIEHPEPHTSCMGTSDEVDAI